MLNEIEISDIINNEVIRKLRERYRNVPEPMFFRSLEKARSLGDLFDILDTFPSDFPVEWSEAEHRWATNKKLFPSSYFAG